MAKTLRLPRKADGIFDAWVAFVDGFPHPAIIFRDFSHRCIIERLAWLACAQVKGRIQL